MTTDTQLFPEIAVEQVDVLIRYNTRQDNENPASWRVLTIDGHADEFSERFADNVIIEVASHTSEDLIAPGVMKWHLRARGYVSWTGNVCRVSGQPAPPAHS